MQKNLFGQTPEQQPRRFPVSTIGTKDHRKCTPEEKSILTSALIKHMRLSDIPRCMETYWKMCVVGVPQEYIVRRVCAFCWEDATGSEILTYATALQSTWIHDPDNAIMRTIIACCKAPKFWSDSEEAELEMLRINIREDVKERAKKGKLVNDDYPPFCRDCYTIQGRFLGAAKKDHPNNRYSGIARGGLNLRAETLAYGALSPDCPSLFDSNAVREAAEQQITIDEWIERKGMTIEQWRKSIHKAKN